MSNVPHTPSDMQVYRILPNTLDVTSDPPLPTLPSFIQSRQDGVFVNPSLVTSDRNFRTFVDHLFAQGWLFCGLDYPLFQNLAYPVEPLVKQDSFILLARKIVAFAPERRALYKEVRLMDGGARAEYMFEPVFFEHRYRNPIYGDTDKSGVVTILGYDEQIRTQPTQLDFDEFVTDMWCKGVRFGMDVKAVETGIALTRMVRAVIATQLMPTPGRDAELKEECEELHRDDSPMIRAGIADLRRFKNRFPQIAKGQKVVSKIPRQFGKPGYKVTGEVVHPDIPKDIDFERISGHGTKIELIDGIQFIVAVADGFLAIDVQSNLISVTLKIENSEGISTKTTGDLSLTVEEFIEHGEVQEGRLVEGKNMKFTSAVYGSLISYGGRIVMEDSLVGGSARSYGGSIVIRRRASNATLESKGGSVEVKYAENCMIFGQTVTIGHAINCDIVAKELYMDWSQGCSIAARSAIIRMSDVRKDDATMVSMVVPDPEEFNRRNAKLKEAVTEVQCLMDAILAAINDAKSNPDFSKFLAIKEMVQSKKLELTSAQEQNLRQMQKRHQPSIKLMEKLMAEKDELHVSLVAKRKKYENFMSAHNALSEGMVCKIAKIVGSTVVQQIHTKNGEAHFEGVSGKELHNLLRTRVNARWCIYADDHGSMEWKYSPCY
jgi:hypothetical protein